MLVTAAAKQWNVPVTACTTDNGCVVHQKRASKRELRFAGSVRRRSLPAPQQVMLWRDPAQFKYIGKIQKKRGAAQKAMGKFPQHRIALLPGMLVAVVTRAPVIDARLRTFDAKAALAVPGEAELRFRAGRTCAAGGTAGVAVLADDYWSAHQGQAALHVEWEDSPFETFDSGTLAARQAAWLDDPAARVVPTIRSGAAGDAWPHTARVVEASYSMPYKAPNPLEPINVTAWAKGVYWGIDPCAVDGRGPKSSAAFRSSA